MTDTDKKSFKISHFTGEGDVEWRVWSSKMLAFAQKKEYHAALVSVLDLTNEDNQKKNLEAISDLTIACDGEAWEIIQDADGNNVTAHDKWTALEQAFHPEEIDDYVDLTNQFKRCEMENEYDNPKIWIRKLQAINRHLGGIPVDPNHRHDDVQMIAEIFLKLPKSYSEFVTSCNLRGVGTGTTQEMLKDLERYYKRTIKNQGKETNRSGQRSAFVAIGGNNHGKPSKAVPRNHVNFTKSFKGLCNKCGKQGHKVVDCRVKPENYVKSQNGAKKSYFDTHAGYINPRTKMTDKISNSDCHNCGKRGPLGQRLSET